MCHNWDRNLANAWSYFYKSFASASPALAAQLSQLVMMSSTLAFVASKYSTKKWCNIPSCTHSYNKFEALALFMSLLLQSQKRILMGCKNCTTRHHFIGCSSATSSFLSNYIMEDTTCRCRNTILNGQSQRFELNLPVTVSTHQSNLDANIFSSIIQSRSYQELDLCGVAIPHYQRSTTPHRLDCKAQ